VFTGSLVCGSMETLYPSACSPFCASMFSVASNLPCTPPSPLSVLPPPALTAAKPGLLIFLQLRKQVVASEVCRAGVQGRCAGPLFVGLPSRVQARGAWVTRGLGHQGLGSPGAGRETIVSPPGYPNTPSLQGKEAAAVRQIGCAGVEWS